MVYYNKFVKKSHVKIYCDKVIKLCFYQKKKSHKVMLIIEEYEEYDPNDIVIIESLTYYKLEFLTNDWIKNLIYL